MQCSNCSSELGEGAAFCGTCGAANGANKPSREPEAINPPPIPKIEESPGRKIWTAVRILAVIAGTIFFASRLFSFSAEAFGFALGTLLLPFLVAYAITRKERGWSRFSYWFMALSILCHGITAPKTLANLPHSDLLKEMAGTKPVDSDLPSRDRATLAVAREIFGDLQESNRSYNERLAAFTPEIQWLFSKESFTSRVNIKKALSVIDQMMALERESLATAENFPAVVKSRLDQSNLSEKEKRDFFQGFSSKFNNSKTLTLGKNAIDAEQTWADAGADLYKFAYLHVNEIHVENGHLAITSDSTLDQFNTMLDRSEKLQEKYLAAEKQFDAARNEYFKEQGITAADLGLDK
jgi:hypothetical protein